MDARARGVLVHLSAQLGGREIPLASEYRSGREGLHRFAPVALPSGDGRPTARDHRLCGRHSYSNGPTHRGAFGAKQLREKNALDLINLIQQAIEPGYWQPNGPGTIVYFDPTRTIMIRASAEMHYQLESPSIFGGR